MKAFNSKEALYIPKNGFAPMLFLEFLRDNPGDKVIQICCDVEHNGTIYIPIKLLYKSKECCKYINLNL